MIKERRGQFFLIAAIVIIGVLTSIATVQNKVFIPEPDLTLFDLAEEIQFEGQQVIISSTLSQLNAPGSGNRQLKTNLIFQDLENLADQYTALNPDIEMIFAFDKNQNKGNRDYAGIEYLCIQGAGGSTDNTCQQTTKTFIQKNNILRLVASDQLRVTLSTGEIMLIKMKPDQAFFFVLRKVDDGQVFVITP
jgi:hypothetical protein